MPVALRIRITDRVTALSDRDFRRFFLGFATSALGTQMAGVALAFAVLASGRGGTALGAVMAARILPLVLMLLLGGAAADRLGSRAVMIAGDLLRCGAQAGVALLFAWGGPPLWAVLLLAALSGVGEAAFAPSFQALVPQLAAEGELTQTNSLLSTARSVAAVAGPALAGLCVALAGAATVLAFDAATYAVSVYAVWRLPVRRPATGADPADRPDLLGDLREGWRQFRGRTWLWTTSLQFCLFNFLVWAPFLVLGPLVAQQRLGGAGAWGAVMACYGGGAILGGVALLGHRPDRPLFWSVVASTGWALPSAALALAAPTPVVCTAALVAGVGSALCATLYATVTQRQIPAEVRGRVSSWTSLGSFALGPLGLAAAGPVAAALTPGAVLAFGALWQFATVALLAALPSIRHEHPGDHPDRPHPPAPA